MSLVSNKVSANSDETLQNSQPAPKVAMHIPSQQIEMTVRRSPPPMSIGAVQPFEVVLKQGRIGISADLGDQESITHLIRVLEANKLLLPLKKELERAEGSEEKDQT